MLAGQILTYIHISYIARDMFRGVARWKVRIGRRRCDLTTIPICSSALGLSSMHNPPTQPSGYVGLRLFPRICRVVAQSRLLRCGAHVFDTLKPRITSQYSKTKQNTRDEDLAETEAGASKARASKAASPNDHINQTPPLRTPFTLFVSSITSCFLE